jgi:transposase-like protein
MPSKLKQSAGTTSVPELKVPAEFLDQPVKGPMTAGRGRGNRRSLKKAVIKRAMGAKLSQYLGYAPSGSKPADQDNHRNGTTGKTVLTGDGAVRIEVPRRRRRSVPAD